VRKSAVDLLVVGSIHRRGAERVLMGSTAEYLVNRAPCDVLAIPAVPANATSTSEVIV
jgi:nucleotide-binding universal stress UspA family protein